MMVTFVSQCEKKALKSTRRVLDAFADRIGDCVWQTIITEDGLAVVRRLLRQRATKNTAVACHWMRSRHRSELVWIVGNRNKFNKEGLVPVNTTQNNIAHQEWENNWEHLAQIKALVGVAALIHDWGKASCLFQKKLQGHTALADPLRHEWISCALLYALVISSGNTANDEGWLTLLQNWEFDEQILITQVQHMPVRFHAELPPVAKLVAWLIVSHHKLPGLRDKNERNGFSGVAKADFLTAFQTFSETWGYKNENDDFAVRVKQCFTFPAGVLKQSNVLAKQVKKWAGRLKQEQAAILSLLTSPSLRLVLQYARLSLMLSDHSVSSMEAEKNWNGDNALFANTDREKKHALKQKLDEHLVRVANQALRIAHQLPRFSAEMEKAYDVKALKQKSPPAFAWQDKVVDKIKKFRAEQQMGEEEQGWFVVNMASTGCGKTFANAKIMQAIAADGESLRYILALGLRTLTLQTGDEYRQKIGLTKEELAVIIGSAAVQELHEGSQQQTTQAVDEFAQSGSESQEALLEEAVDYENTSAGAFLQEFFPKDAHGISEKHKAFLHAPVLSCTIDHIIAATETIKGGKYILPFLRLLSSDLVIDEIDDFDKRDLIAIGRLIHLAGMLGRKVAISSATIPPALAEGLFRAYQSGWECYRSFYHVQKLPIAVWCDEFGAKVELLQGTTGEERCRCYAALHDQFVTKRIAKLKQQQVKRKAYIVPCEDIVAEAGDGLEQQYFRRIQETIQTLHNQYHSVDVASGKKVSFGVVRVANISPCIALGDYLKQSAWDEEYAPHIMVYHSRQVLLLRHEQERHLDAVLKRKEKWGEQPAAFSQPIIRQHIDAATATNVIFVLVATPVEEVGRDHDFDWAIIEPSSYRSVIQLAGRVLRHRQLKEALTEPNIAIMQYNLKALRDDGKPAFCRPGYETSARYALRTHSMCELVEEEKLKQGVDAIPRIEKRNNLKPRESLVDLEHAVMNDFKDASSQGPECLQGWLSSYWWTTALPQQMNRFRDSAPETKLYLQWKDGRSTFCEKTAKGELVPCEREYGIVHGEADAFKERQWLLQDYKRALEKQLPSTKTVAFLSIVEMEKELTTLSEKFGEVRIPQNDGKRRFIYSDQFGLRQKT